MRRSYLCHCQPGDVLDDVFVISNKQFSASSTGKFFIKAFISDRTLQVIARMWNATKDIFNAMPDGGFARIRGRVENYQNNLQFIIEQIGTPKEGSFEIADLIPHTTKDIPQMCARLLELLGSIQNRHLAALVQAYIDDPKLMDQFCKAPAAMSFHHSFIGGLLEHTLNSIEVAEAVCKFYPAINRDLVIAGIFLHDIAKTWELVYDCSFGYTDGGQLVGHIVKSAVWVEQRRQAAQDMLGEEIPQNLIDVLQHIIISHHGTPEFGAIKPPSTPEAIAVHAIENMDAKLTMALANCRGEALGNNEGNWTEYVKALGGRLYRPDPAPAQVDDSQPATAAPVASPAAPVSPAVSAPAPTRPKPAPAQLKPAPPAPMTVSNPAFQIERKK